MKEKIYLSEMEKNFSSKELSKKYGVSVPTILVAKKRGWIANKLGRSSHRMEEGKLPKGVSVNDIIRDTFIAAIWVKNRLNLKWQELDDIRQVGLVRLLELTAEPGFANSFWRKKVAYWIGMRYATTQILRFNVKFCLDFGKIEEDLSFKDISFEERETSIDCEKFLHSLERLKKKDKELIIKWMDYGKNKPSKKVIKILKSIRKPLA